MAKPKSVAFLAVLVGAIVLAGGEAAVRYRESREATSQGSVVLQWYPHARLQRALVHDVDYFGRIHINHLGFRGPEIQLRKSPESIRIMVVGASTTFAACAGTD